MGVHIAWGNQERTRLAVAFRGLWTLADFEVAVDQAAMMMASQPHQVHIVADFSESRMITTTMLSGARYAAYRVQSNLGAIVILGASSSIKVMIHTAMILEPVFQPHVYFTNHDNSVDYIITHHAHRGLRAAN